MSVPPPMRVVTDDPDERSMAALAHGSTVLNFFFPGLGVIAAGAIWLTQKERSAYVANQALQSTVFQLAVALLSVVLGVGGALLMVAGGILGALTVVGFVLLPIGIIALIGLAPVAIIGLLYGLVAAYEAYQGRPFRYWLIGDLVSPK